MAPDRNYQTDDVPRGPGDSHRPPTAERSAAQRKVSPLSACDTFLHFYIFCQKCRNVEISHKFLHFYISNFLKPLFPKFAHRATPRRNRGHLPRWTSGGSVPRRDPPPPPWAAPGPACPTGIPALNSVGHNRKLTQTKKGAPYGAPNVLPLWPRPRRATVRRLRR